MRDAEDAEKKVRKGKEGGRGVGCVRIPKKRDSLVCLVNQVGIGRVVDKSKKKDT